jgi:hypothetical protein
MHCSMSTFQNSGLLCVLLLLHGDDASPVQWPASVCWWCCQAHAACTYTYKRAQLAVLT